MAESYSKKGSRAQFLKAKLDKNQVRPLGGQSSAMLKSFSEANVLIYIPTEAETVLKGEEVLVYHIHV
jgi:molybdopterin molybdotransferase